LPDKFENQRDEIEAGLADVTVPRPETVDADAD
jgi:glyoxalase family protein